MTCTAQEILEPAEKLLARFPRGAAFGAHRLAGQLKRYALLEGSNHEKLLVRTTQDNMIGWVSDFPIIRDMGADFSITAESLRENGKIVVKYRLTLMGLNINQPASPRLRTAAEMMQGARDRLAEVSQLCGSESNDVSRWNVQSAGRHPCFIVGRSARGAAWTFCALYVRSRKEVANWKTTADQITLLSQVFEKSAWIDPAPGHHTPG